MKIYRCLAGLALIGLLSACGSRYSDDEAAVDNTRVPESALNSSAAFTLYAGSLVSSESGAPVAFNDSLSPPKSETEEPLALR